MRASSLARLRTTRLKMPLSQPDPTFALPTPRSRRRLRDIAGGYSIDRWPIKIDIAEGETPMSWFRRVSDRYQLTPRQLCYSMGIKLGNNAKIAVVLNRHRDTVKAALDVWIEDFTTTHDEYLRSPWLGSFVDSAHRFCPLCLQENGCWKASWGSPLSVVCPRHRIFYVDQCPQCGAQPWRTDAWVGQCAPVHICTARLAAVEAGPKRKVGQWCGADLRQAPRTPAPDTVVQAQGFLTGDQRWATERSAPTSLCRFGIDAP